MNKYMEIALQEAKKSLLTDDVPVGAVIVEKGKIISKSHNTKEKKQSVIRHAEINAVEKACKKKKTWYLNDCEIYVTMEPCEMCMGALKEARIKKIIYAVKKEKLNRLKEPNLEQINDAGESKKLLKLFFENKRK
ncbi:MAG: nucleoside deaminase [Bacilli bacterium]|nr:nucleoside deaminase [Bacilli bacterium]